MKKILSILIVIITGITFVLTTNSCKVNQEIADKSGAQLWGENCRRCHNAPDPNTHYPENWVTVGMHMQSRALLTNMERDKIIQFLQQ